MDLKNNKLILDLAKPEDSKEILQILENSTFKGDMSLVYTKRPDPLKSFNYECDESIIFVGRDTEKKSVTGVSACLIRNYFINGEVKKVAYLTGLRLKEEYQKGFYKLHKGYKLLQELLHEKNVSYTYTTILEDNLYAKKLFEKRRPIMPNYDYISDYKVLLFKTGVSFKKNNNNFFRKATTDDIPRILDFINSIGKHSQLFPVLDENIFNNSIPNLSYDKFYILSDSNENIIACGALWDQSSYKQYIMDEYNGLLKYIYPISSCLKLFGYPKLPKTKSILKFGTLSFLTIKDNNIDIFKEFFSKFSKSIMEYPFFTLGLTPNNCIYNSVKELPSIEYSSRVYLVDWNKNGKITNEILGKNKIHIECGFL